MKRLLLGVVGGFVLGAAAAWWIGRGGTIAPTPAVTSSEESRPRDRLRLDAGKRAAAGIVVARVRAEAVPPVIAAFGRVLDPAPYVTMVAEVATARAALTASEKELDRVRQLRAADGNASEQALETAEAAATRDRAALASAEIRLLVGWGRVLAEHAGLGETRRLLENGAALIRIDLLPGDRAAAEFRSAAVTPIGSAERFDVEIIGPAPLADPQVQGTSYLALERSHALPVGAALRVTVPAPGEPVKAAVIPASALVYHEGQAWAYRLAGDQFGRVSVRLGRRINADVVVESGLSEGDEIAVQGVQQLLSAELVGGIPAEER